MNTARIKHSLTDIYKIRAEFYVKNSMCNKKGAARMDSSYNL